MYKASTPAAENGRTVLRRNKLLLTAVATTMVFAAYLWKAFVATLVIVPSVSALPSSGNAFPSLLDATVGELTAGLDKGDFSSVDLVNVSQDYLYITTWLICQGIHRSNP